MINVSVQDRFEKRFMRTLRGKVKGDKVVVALSGGKDSSTALYLTKKALKGKEIIAITIDEGIKGYREKTIEYAKKLAESIDVPLYLYSLKEEYGTTMDEIKEKNKCTYCGVLRRKLITQKAKELGCESVVIGHNLDDEAQVAMMNYIRGEYNRIARGDARVKPLKYTPEEEVIQYAKLQGIEVYPKKCPYRVNAYRKQVGELLNKLEEKYPGTKLQIVKSNEKLAEMIPITTKPKKCRKCGGMSSTGLCKACELLDRIS